MPVLQAAAPDVATHKPWLPGLPHAAAGLATWAVFGGQACLTGMLFATLASFVIYLPMTALVLNRGEALAPDAPAPVLTRRARMVLLGLWTATAWASAGLASVAS